MSIQYCGNYTGKYALSNISIVFARALGNDYQSYHSDMKLTFYNSWTSAKKLDSF